MPKLDGTPCKHKCLDRETCTHDCCKDQTNPPGDEALGAPTSPADRTDNSSEEEDAAGARNLAQMLGQALGQALNNTPKSNVLGREIAKQKLKVVMNEQLQPGDIHILLKVITYLQNVETLADQENYFICATVLHSEFPDTAIRTICNYTILDAAEEGYTLSSEDWKGLCRTICMTLLGSFEEVKKHARLWLAEIEARARNERLESYYGRYGDALKPTMWLRRCFDKPTDGTWMTKMRNNFIEKLNCTWAQVLVMDMAETHSLNEIFHKLQKMNRTKKLDDNWTGQAAE